MARGAGELLMTSIDSDGTLGGFDLELLTAVAATVTVPVIASGGAGGPEGHRGPLCRRAAAAALAASIFHDGTHMVAPVRRDVPSGGLPIQEIVSLASTCRADPCVVQDDDSGEVLMLAWVDDEVAGGDPQQPAGNTSPRGRADELWQKGATVRQHHGCPVAVIRLRPDTMLMTVRPAGPACHTGEQTCSGHGGSISVRRCWAELRQVFEQRRSERRHRAATWPACCPASGNGRSARWARRRSRCCWRHRAAPELVAEVADLWFHSMLLLARDGLDPLAPLEVLQQRRKR